MDDAAARERVARVEQLLDDVEALPDPAARETAASVVQALVELYGEGLARIMAGVPEPEALAEDELVEHLLLLHDLHPVPLEQRVRGALEEVRPYMESHGGGVELVSVERGVVSLRLEGSCSGCPASTMTLKLAIEDAIRKAAPDVEEILADGVVAGPAQPPLLQIEVVAPQGANGNGAGDAWTTAGSLAELSGGGAVVKRVGGDDVLVARLEADTYAYRPRCAGCREELGAEALQGGELECPSCSRRFDVRRAGRCLDEPELYLEPVPLLTSDDGLVRVALGTAVA